MDRKLLTSAESPSLRNGIIVAFFRSVGYGVVYVCGECVMWVCVWCGVCVWCMCDVCMCGMCGVWCMCDVWYVCGVGICVVCVMCVCVACVCGVFWSHLFSNVLFMSRHVQP